MLLFNDNDFKQLLKIHLEIVEIKNNIINKFKL